MEKNSATLRDSFWNRVYERARDDRNIVVVAADMGAPALDRFKLDLPHQFVDVGIAEQQAIALAAGLALEGKKVFAYAIAPFISLRCLEQIRVDLAAMKVPVTVVGVGAGFSYEESGPTHHAIEDVAMLRPLPNMEIETVSDAVMAAAAADRSCRLSHANYVRLDRQRLPVLYNEAATFGGGLEVLREGPDACILACGNMVHQALAVAEGLSRRSFEVGVVDVHRLPIAPPLLTSALEGVPRVFTLEEHVLPGGLGSAVCEVLADQERLVPVHRLGLALTSGYCYQYGGRQAIQKRYGLDPDSVLETISVRLSGSKS